MQKDDGVRRRLGRAATFGVLVFAALVLAWIVWGLEGPGRLDRAIQRDLHGAAGSPEVAVARNLTRIGIGVLLLGVLAVGGLVARAHHEGWVRRGGWAPIAVPVLAVCVASTASTTVKLVVGRERPPLEGRFAPAHGSSFPSGHTTASTAGYVALALVVAARASTRTGAVAAVAAGMTIAAAIGWTRVVLGVHWPSDVLAGWVLGTAGAFLAVLLWARFERSRGTENPGRPTTDPQ